MQSQNVCRNGSLAPSDLQNIGHGLGSNFIAHPIGNSTGNFDGLSNLSTCASNNIPQFRSQAPRAHPQGKN